MYPYHSSLFLLYMLECLLGSHVHVLTLGPGKLKNGGGEIKMYTGYFTFSIPFSLSLNFTSSTDYRIACNITHPISVNGKGMKQHWDRMKDNEVKLMPHYYAWI